MGYEYLIKVKLTSKERQDIETLLKNKPIFSHIYTINDEEIFEFKSENNLSQMPDFLAGLDEEGVYICQNLTDEVWSGLEDLKAYLHASKTTITVDEL